MPKSKALFQFIFTQPVPQQVQDLCGINVPCCKMVQFLPVEEEDIWRLVEHVFLLAELQSHEDCFHWLFSVCLCWSSQTYQSEGNYSCEALVSCICLLFNQTSEFLQFAENNCIGKLSLWLLHFLSHLPAPDISPSPDCSAVIQKMRLNSLSQIWYAIAVKDLVPLTFQLKGWNINIWTLLCTDGKFSASHFLLLLLTHPFHMRKPSIVFINIARTKNKTINGIVQPKHGTPCLLRWPRLSETFSWGLTHNLRETPAFWR